MEVPKHSHRALPPPYHPLAVLRTGVRPGAEPYDLKFIFHLPFTLVLD
jgi:hypothetical protein